jgi:hypothetical protein
LVEKNLLATATFSRASFSGAPGFPTAAIFIKLMQPVEVSHA